MKLFSGDDKGKIVYSALDLDQVSTWLERCFLKLFIPGGLCVCVCSELNSGSVILSGNISDNTISSFLPSAF